MLREAPARGAGARFLGQSRAGVRRARGRAVSRARARSRGGEFFVHSDVAGVPTDRSNLCVRAFERLRPADGLAFQIRSETAAAGLGSVAAIVLRLAAADRPMSLDAPLFELAQRSRARQRGGGAARRLRGLRGRRARAHRAAAGLEGVVAIPPEQVPTGRRGRRMPDAAPLREAVANMGHVAARARAGQGRPLAGRPRVARRAPPAAPPPPLPALDGAGRARGGARRSGRDHLGRRPDGPVLVPVAANGNGDGTASRRSEAPDCELRRVTFAPGGATCALWRWAPPLASGPRSTRNASVIRAMARWSGAPTAGDDWTLPLEARPSGVVRGGGAARGRGGDRPALPARARARRRWPTETPAGARRSCATG